MNISGNNGSNFSLPFTEIALHFVFAHLQNILLYGKKHSIASLYFENVCSVKFNVLLRNRKLILTSELRLWPQFPQRSSPQLTVGPLHNQSANPVWTDTWECSRKRLLFNQPNRMGWLLCFYPVFTFNVKKSEEYFCTGCKRWTIAALSTPDNLK